MKNNKEILQEVDGEKKDDLDDVYVRNSTT